MPFMIGNCCFDQVSAPPSGGGGSGDPGSGGGGGGGTTFVSLNEVIMVVNADELILPWNATRIARFGDAGVFYTETQGEDGVWRRVAVEIVPNNIVNTTSYRFDFGGLGTHRVTIT